MTNVTCFGQEDETMGWTMRMAQRRVDWDILRGTGASEICEDFLRRLIVTDPRNRMSVHEALQHAWISSIENIVPEGFVGSQSQQSAPKSQDSQSHSQSQREGTAELGEPVTSSTTDPYNFEGVVSKDADGNDRWRARSPAADETHDGIDCGDTSNGYVDSTVDMMDTSPQKNGRGRTIGLVGRTSSVVSVEDEVLQSQVAELHIDRDQKTPVGTPPPARRRKQHIQEEMSWEQVNGEEDIGDGGDRTPIEVVPSAEQRPVKRAPKGRRQTVSAGAPPPIVNGTATPKKQNYNLGVGVPSTNKRKARDLDFDADLSSASPSGDERPITTLGGKDLDDNNRSFSTTSSNSTVRGKPIPKSVPSDDEDAMETPPPPTKQRRQTTGGMAVPAGRSSARLRDRNGGGPATVNRRTSGDAKRAKGVGRRAPSVSTSDSEDEPQDVPLMRKTGRKGGAAAPPPTPVIATAPPRRNTRNGAAAVKVARIR